MNLDEVDIQINELETRIDRLRSLYEQYFMGIERLEPTVPRKDVERRLHELRKTRFQNTAKRFKFQTLVQRYNTMQQYWGRICREIENGTYKRHKLRAERTVGALEDRYFDPGLASLAPNPDESSSQERAVRAATAGEQDMLALLDEGVDLAAELERASAAALAQAVPENRLRPPGDRASPLPALGSTEAPKGPGGLLGKLGRRVEVPAPLPGLNPGVAVHADLTREARANEARDLTKQTEQRSSLEAVSLPKRITIPPTGQPSAADAPTVQRPSVPRPGPRAGEEQSSGPSSSARPLPKRISLAPTAPLTGGAPRPPGSPAPSSPEAQRQAAAAAGTEPPARKVIPPPSRWSSAAPAGSPSPASPVAGGGSAARPPGAGSPSPASPVAGGGLTPRPLTAPSQGLGPAGTLGAPRGPAPALRPPPPRQAPADQTPSLGASRSGVASAVPAPKLSASPSGGARPPLPIGGAPRPGAPPAVPRPSRLPPPKPPLSSRPPGPAPSLSEERLRILHAGYQRARAATNATPVSYEKLARSIRETEEKLKTKAGGKRVDFEVVVEDGRAILKPRLG